jgi:hypothetical protein
MEPPDRKLDLALALRAYQKIVDLGRRDGEVCEFGGLTAVTDFDGYTVSISDGIITLRVLFHSRFVFEPQEGRAIDQFLIRLDKVANANADGD